MCMGMAELLDEDTGLVAGLEHRWRRRPTLHPWGIRNAVQPATQPAPVAASWPRRNGRSGRICALRREPAHVTSPRAWESADRDALIALLTDDVFISMPPMPFDYEGPDAEGTRADGAGGHGLSRFARRNPTSTNPMRPSVGEGAVEEPA